MKASKGFTLIELLVVIAIIGILSGIVLVNVQSARTKAKDAAIKANLSQMTVAGELFYDTDSTYAAFCASADAGRILTALDGVMPSGGVKACKEAADAWATCAHLNTPNDKAWCVDNIGNAKQIDDTACTAAWSATVCP